MSISSVMQPTVIAAHALSLAVLIALSRNSETRWAAVLSHTAINTSGLIALGLAGFMVVLLAAGGGPGIIPPIAFAGGFATAFFVYLVLFIAALRFRSRRAEANTAAVLIALAVFNGFFFVLPAAARTTVNVYVRSSDSKPIAGATFTYTTDFDKHAVTQTSDPAGQITLYPKLGETIDGAFAPSANYGKATLYISPNRGVKDGWAVQRHWSVSFGSNAFQAGGFFLAGFDDSKTHAVEVYLPSADGGDLLPYSALSHLASRLQEAQRSGAMFNPEMSCMNLESYSQLSEVAQAYDVHSSIHGYAHQVFQFLGETHDLLSSILKKLSDEKLDPAIRDRGLSQMIAVLQIPATDPLSWQQKRDLIRSRLDSDAAILKGIPAP